MRVRSILGARTGNVKTMTPADSLRDAIALMGEARVGCIVVLENDARLVGVLSERDVIGRLIAHGAAAFDKTVSAAMTVDPVTCTPAEDVYDAIEKMKSRRCRHLPVVEEGRVIGVISARDVMETIWDNATERDLRTLLTKVALA